MDARTTEKTLDYDSFFSPVVFSLRPTAAQNRKKRKHQKAIYDQLSTKLRYSIVHFFSFIFPAYTTSGFDMSGTMNSTKL